MTSERRQAKVICVALGSSDRITLINHNNRVKAMVEKAIQDTWPSGVQSRKEKEVLGHVLHEFKMNGNPWRVCTSTCGIIMRPAWPHYEQVEVDKMKKEENIRFDSKMAEYKKSKEKAAAASAASDK